MDMIRLQETKFCSYAESRIHIAFAAATETPSTNVQASVKPSIDQTLRGQRANRFVGALGLKLQRIFVFLADRDGRVSGTYLAPRARPQCQLAAARSLMDCERALKA
jgi:hypothetical protein